MFNTGVRPTNQTSQKQNTKPTSATDQPSALLRVLKLDVWNWGKIDQNHQITKVTCGGVVETFFIYDEIKVWNWCEIDQNGK